MKSASETGLVNKQCRRALRIVLPRQWRLAQLLHRWLGGGVGGLAVHSDL